jgi:acyl carrier protein
MSRHDEVRAIVEEFGEVKDDGALALDSFAVINVVEAIEDRLGVRFAASEVTRERFATLDALARFVEEKLA